MPTPEPEVSLEFGLSWRDQGFERVFMVFMILWPLGIVSSCAGDSFTCCHRSRSQPRGFAVFKEEIQV